MRFKFDKRKSHRLRNDKRRRMGFEEVQELFDQDHYLEQRSDVPEQWLTIGWAQRRLMSVIFEF